MRVVLEKPRCPRRCSTGTEPCWPGSLPRHFECSCSSIILIPGHGTRRNVSNTPFDKGRISFSKSIYSAASETENPRRNIAKAVRRVFFRILVFYVSLCCLCWDGAGPDGGCAQILGIFITGLIVPYNDPNLLQCECLLLCCMTGLIFSL
jgi:hypothetical protein